MPLGRSLLALTLLGSTVAVALPAGQQATFRTGVDLVNLGVTVTDSKGKLVTDLTLDDLEVIEDGKK